MQFHISPTPRQRRIRRIPTIRLQTVKHIRGNCMRNCWADRDMLPRNLARNSIEQSFNKVRKRCNSNDLNSMFEIVAGELRAKLLGGGGARPGYSQRPSPTGVEGAGGTGGPGRGAGGRRWGLAGLRADAPSEARGVDGSRAGRRPPAHTAARPAEQNARQPKRAAARSRSQWSTQRSRAATTSATWTAFRAAPLRRLSPETTRTRPRLPSTAWS